MSTKQEDTIERIELPSRLWSAVTLALGTIDRKLAWGADCHAARNQIIVQRILTPTFDVLHQSCSDCKADNLCNPKLLDEDGTATRECWNCDHPVWFGTDAAWQARKPTS